MADSDGDGAAHEGARGAGSASSFTLILRRHLHREQRRLRFAQPSFKPLPFTLFLKDAKAVLDQHKPGHRLPRDCCVEWARLIEGSRLGLLSKSARGKSTVAAIVDLEKGTPTSSGSSSFPQWVFRPLNMSASNGKWINGLQFSSLFWCWYKQAQPLAYVECFGQFTCGREQCQED
ncbi:hypothetical protein QYE76_063589 [Lolium multiflorum]|uniref:Uncharacterized protein n=1 Tax=Lolium multiflorum TaxID=4521 RepID=A0AAD8W988_LOLMU|nr:hypothetical protein QYE76_063589 [Lolium multiflorum]